MGAVPGLNQIMTSNNKQQEDDELLIVVTPRVIVPNTQAQNHSLALALSKFLRRPATLQPAEFRNFLGREIDQLLKNIIRKRRDALDLAAIDKQGGRAGDLQFFA